jgi:hypothetical protein
MQRTSRLSHECGQPSKRSLKREFMSQILRQIWRCPWQNSATSLSVAPLSPLSALGADPRSAATSGALGPARMSAKNRQQKNGVVLRIPVSPQSPVIKPAANIHSCSSYGARWASSTHSGLKAGTCGARWHCSARQSRLDRRSEQACSARVHFCWPVGPIWSMLCRAWERQ